MKGEEIKLLILLIFNIFTFLLMGIDKSKSRKRSNRISEMCFYLLGLLTGWVGIMFGMYIFNHKTNKFEFKMCLLISIIVNIIIITFIGG